MTPKLILGLVLTGFAFLIGGAELGGSLNKGYVYLLGAGVATAFLLSMAAITGSVMSNGDKEEAAKYEGFGQKISLPMRWLNTNAVLVFSLAAAGYFGYVHHRDTLDLLQKNLAATEKNTRAIVVQTWVMTLTQERKEKLNLEMPDEVRQMQRHRGE
jgi:hypothetical protein